MAAHKRTPDGYASCKHTTERSAARRASWRHTTTTTYVAYAGPAPTLPPRCCQQPAAGGPAARQLPPQLIALVSLTPPALLRLTDVRSALKYRHAIPCNTSITAALTG